MRRTRQKGVPVPAECYVAVDAFDDALFIGQYLDCYYFACEHNKKNNHKVSVWF